jgi:hypothetical protein
MFANGPVLWDYLEDLTAKPLLSEWAAWVSNPEPWD